MMSQLAMKYLGEHDRTGPGQESEVTQTEKRIAQAFKETSPLKANVQELEREVPRVRKMESQVEGLLKKYWVALGELGGATFAVQFDALEPEMTLRRGYLEYRRNVIQLLADNREALSKARRVKKLFCEMAEELTHSMVERWPATTECPFQPVSAEEIAEFQRRLRYQGRQVEQPERHWRSEPATYGI